MEKTFGTSPERFVIFGSLAAGCLVFATVVYKYVAQTRLNLTQVDFQSSNRLTKAHVKSLWDRYDLDLKGYLQPHEIKALVSAFFKKLSSDPGLLVSYVMEIFSECPDELIKKESLSVLSEMLHQMNTQTHRVFEQLMDRLEKDRRGVIHRAEFVSLFAMWFEARVAEELTVRLI